jgi:hypothetical protein
MDELRKDLEWQLLMLIRGQGDGRDATEFIQMLDAYIEAKLKGKK